MEVPREHIHRLLPPVGSQAVLSIWSFALLATPFFAFPGARSGSANAVAFVAAGILAAGLVLKLRAEGPRRYIPPYAKPAIGAASIITLLPYVFFEVGSLPWLVSSTSETLLGYWPEPFASAFAFTSSALGYAPLFASSALLTVGWAFSEEDPRGDELSNDPADRWTLGLAFTIGLLRKPLCPLTGTSGIALCIRLATTSALALLLVLLQDKKPRNAVDVLMAHSVGVAVLNVLSRVASIPENLRIGLSALCLALTVPLAFRAFRAFGGKNKESRSELTSTKDNRPARASMLEGYDLLTPAERSCVDRLAEGRQIADIAEELGKSPSTVRVLLGRSYKKLQVSGASELEARLRSSRDDSEQPNIDDTPITRSTELRAVLIVALFVVALPFGSWDSAWGQGRELYLPLGLGLFASGIFWQLLQRGRYIPQTVQLVLLAAGGIGCLACKVLALTYGTPCPLLFSSVACALIFGYVHASGESPTSPRPNRLRAIDFPPLFVAMALGIGAEELWRSLGFFSILPQLMPLYGALVIGSGIVLWREGHNLCYLAIALGTIPFALVPINQAIVYSSCIFCAVVLIKLGVVGTTLRPPLPFLAPAFGLGILLGDFVIGTYADLLSFNNVALRHIGGQTGLLALGGFVLGITFCITATIIVAYCLHLSNDAAATELGISNSSDSEVRILGFFTAHGLNENESAVLLKIASGMSGSEISEALNYSVGSINNLRASGYAKLGIHSRRELIDYISAGTRLVN